MVLTAILTFVISVRIGGGFEAINRKLFEMNPAYLSHPGVGGAYGWGNYVSMIVMWSFFSIGQPSLSTKFFAMKDYKVMFKAVILGTIGMWLAATLIEWAGVNAIVSIPGLEGKQIDFVVPLILQQQISPIFSALLIAGIVAAGMSTIDSLLIVSTGAITRDIYQKIVNKNASDADIFRLSRYVTIIIGIVAIVFGISRPGTIFKLVLFAFGGLGIWAAPISRSRSGAQNSSHRKSLYAVIPARTKSSSASPRKCPIVRCGGNNTSASTPSSAMSASRAEPS